MESESTQISILFSMSKNHDIINYDKSFLFNKIKGKFERSDYHEKRRGKSNSYDGR